MPVVDDDYLSKPASYSSELGTTVSYRQLISSRFPKACEKLGIAYSEEPVFKRFLELNEEDRTKFVLIYFRSVLIPILGDSYLSDMQEASDEEILSNKVWVSLAELDIVANEYHLLIGDVGEDLLPDQETVS